jgi:hypothetical protein
MLKRESNALQRVLEVSHDGEVTTPLRTGTRVHVVTASYCQYLLNVGKHVHESKYIDAIG